MKFLFWLFEIPLLFLFCIGFTAWWLNPATFWWTAIIAVALSYLAFFLFVFTIFAFFQGYKGLGSFHVFLLICYAIRIFPPVYFEEAKPHQEDLKVLNYNLAPPIFKFDNNTTNFKSAWNDFLSSTNLNQADIIVLNEQHANWINGKFYPSPAIQTLVENGYRFNPPKSNLTITQSVGTKLISGLDNPSSLNSTTDYRTYMHRTEFVYKGKPAAIYALHLASLGGKKPWNERKTKIRSKQTWLSYIRQYRAAYKLHVQQVIQIKRRLKSEQLPYLIIGDFNATMHNWEYRHLAKGLQDVYLAKGKGWGGTYRDDYSLVRIDFILASKEWLPISAKTFKTNLSDHLPIFASLRWR